MASQTPAQPALLTSFGRVSFPSLVVPTSMEETQKKKYSVILLFPTTDPFVAMAQAAVQKAIADKWPTKINDADFLSKLDLPIHDAASKSYDGYGPGQHYIRFSSQRKPRVVDQQKRDLTPDTNANTYPDLYPGCWARASYNVFAWERKNPQGVVVKRGVSFGLFNVQKVRDDSPFGGGYSDADADFDELPVSDDAASLLE